MKLFKSFLNELKKGYLLHIAAVLATICLFSSIVLFLVEKREPSSDVKNIGDAMWWALVTLTTVGYGDTVPHTALGRAIAVLTIFSGVGLISILTAIIASIFVEKRIMEERGLENVHISDQIVICGWNNHGEKLIHGLIREIPVNRLKIVLVNELGVEEISSIRARFEDIKIDFVRGDFTKEGILHKARVQKARAVIFLADTSGPHGPEKADQRTVLGTLAVKSMAPNTRTIAELMDAENKPHLRRANIDEVIIRGENSGALLASTAVTSGMNRVIKDLISYDSENKLWKMGIPAKFVGKRYEELFDHVRSKHGALPIALIREEKGFNIRDILSEDLSAIDDFILRKFRESELDVFSEKGNVMVKINPDSDYIIAENDSLVVISSSKPRQEV